MEINKKFNGMIKELDDQLGPECKMTKKTFLLLQDIILVKLAEPYVKLTERSRNKRRRFLPLEGLG